MLVELRPAGGGKGHAIACFMAEPPFAGRIPAFAGDDVTDEDGFIEVNRMNGITVRIGENGDSAARWRLTSVTALIGWLHGGGLSEAATANEG
jgi:trehalose 6-phosphate phosphatase